MRHSLQDLTFVHQTAVGSVPEKLVGAAHVVVNSTLYLFGGRQTVDQEIVSDLYSFSFESSVWKKIGFHSDDEVPGGVYFHTMDYWNNHLVLFGGLANKADVFQPEDLCALNDIYLFNLSTRRWLPKIRPQGFTPHARYAHLSSITGNLLFIMGGQDASNGWIDDICLYNLETEMWVQQRRYPRHWGSYRSTATTRSKTVCFPDGEASRNTPTYPEKSSLFIRLPYSVDGAEANEPSDIFMYSNNNFADVNRELQVFSPTMDSDGDFSTQNISECTSSGAPLPPGLRFPANSILGSHMILSGVHFSNQTPRYSVWALDIVTKRWIEISLGKTIDTGSWLCGCLWPSANKFVVFGNKDGNALTAYNSRSQSWDHLIVVDLEAYGIYQPPLLKTDFYQQEAALARLREKQDAPDFNIICDDGRNVPCSKKILEDRWPWFRHQRRLSAESDALADDFESPVDPRLTAKSLKLSEPYPITMALVQYFYALALLTPLQHAPAVLSRLLILATDYQIPYLRSLVKHAMHCALSISTAEGVYDVATFCGCRSLQIRARNVLSEVHTKVRERDSSSKPPSRGQKIRNVSHDRHIPAGLPSPSQAPLYAAPSPPQQERKAEPSESHYDRQISVVSEIEEKDIHDIADLILPSLSIDTSRGKTQAPVPDSYFPSHHRPSPTALSALTPIQSPSTESDGQYRPLRPRQTSTTTTTPSLISSSTSSRTESSNSTSESRNISYHSGLGSNAPSVRSHFNPIKSLVPDKLESSLSLETKEMKAERKRRKKEEEKIKKERLAMDLKDRARRRVEESKSTPLKSPKKRKEPVVVMYDGLGFM